MFFVVLVPSWLMCSLSEVECGRSGLNLNVPFDLLSTGIDNGFVGTRWYAFDCGAAVDFRDGGVRTRGRDNLREHPRVNIAADVIETIARRREYVVIPRLNAEVARGQLRLVFADPQAVQDFVVVSKFRRLTGANQQHGWCEGLLHLVHERHIGLRGRVACGLWLEDHDGGKSVAGGWCMARHERRTAVTRCDGGRRLHLGFRFGSRRLRTRGDANGAGK